VYAKVCKALADNISEKTKAINDQLGWNHAPGVDAKKQALWTRATIEALDFLARHRRPHEGRTEEKDLLIIAYFLKALYPNIWTGEVEKTKERLRKRIYDFRYR